MFGISLEQNSQASIFKCCSSSYNSLPCIDYFIMIPTDESRGLFVTPEMLLSSELSYVYFCISSNIYGNFELTDSFLNEHCKYHLIYSGWALPLVICLFMTNLLVQTSKMLENFSCLLLKNNKWIKFGHYSYMLQVHLYCIYLASTWPVDHCNVNQTNAVHGE